MLADWFVLGDNEFANNARVLTYARNGRASRRISFGEIECPTLATMLGESYSLPEDDDAPWFDATIPESRDFAGLLTTEVDGLETSPASRAAIDRITEGAAFSRQRYSGRQIVFTGFLVARTDAGLDYGYRWLTKVLAGSCDAAEQGEDLCFLSSCPDCGITPAPTEVDMDPVLRTLRHVSLTSGPNITERHGEGCGCCGGCSVARVEFTLTAGIPWIFGETLEVTAPVAFYDPDEDEADPITFRKISVTSTCACGDDSCPGDSLCPVPAAPPRLPAYQSDCACLPLHAYRKNIALSATVTSVWFDAALVVTIAAGPTELRNLRIQLIPNAVGYDCFHESLDAECLSCTEIFISQVPEDSTLTIDGPTRTISIECADAISDGADRVLSGNRPYSFPIIDCVNYCVRIDADPLHTDEAATIGIDLVRRYL